MIELEEPIEVTTELGDGYAILVSEGRHDQWWTVVLSNGAMVTFPQKKIRVKRNYTASRNITASEMRKIIEPRSVCEMSDAELEEIVRS